MYPTKPIFQLFNNICDHIKGCNILKADALGQNGLMHAAQYGKLMTCYFFLHANQFFEEEDQLGLYFNWIF